MAFSANLDSVQRSSDPLKILVSVTYRDDDVPDWHDSKTIEVTLDPALNPGQQRAAIQQAVVDDATPYKLQIATMAAVNSLVDTQVDVP